MKFSLPALILATFTILSFTLSSAEARDLGTVRSERSDKDRGDDRDSCPSTVIVEDEIRVGPHQGCNFDALATAAITQAEDLCRITGGEPGSNYVNSVTSSLYYLCIEPDGSTHPPYAVTATVRCTYILCSGGPEL